MLRIQPTTAKKSSGFTLKATAAAIALFSGSAMAASTGGFSTTDGGNVSGAKSFTAATYQEINTIIANAKLDANGSKVSGGAYPLIITYTGNEDSLINQMIKDHTVDSSGNCPKPRWSEAYRYVEIKEFTKGITIIGANGSSANFGVVVNKSSNVIIRNMKIGALAGASNDADMLRIDSGTNVWVDHNELFAVNNECKGSPDGDLTFESAIDIKKDSHNITVSYNLIRDSKKVGLDGSSSSVWDLRNNNVKSPADFATYNITWSSGGTIDATNWTTTAPFPISIPYSYAPVSPQCVKDNLAQYAGVGKNGAQLTSSTCGGTPTSSSAPSSVAVVSSSKSSSSAAVVSSSKSSSSIAATSSSKSSVAVSSSKSSSSAASGPVLGGTGDYPSGFSKCADLGETCSVTSGDGWVAFGRKGKWVTKKVSVGGSIACTVAAFGSDPAGNPNKCSYKK